MQYIITEANSETLKAKWHIASQREKSAKISGLIYLSIHLFIINYLFEAVLIFSACFFSIQELQPSFISAGGGSPLVGWFIPEAFLKFGTKF